MIPMLVAVLLTSSAASVVATTYVVDPSGGGDFETLPSAMWYVNWPDTVELVPGTYAVTSGVPGWPIGLDDTSPCVVGRDGADHTTLLGDGVTVAFLVPYEVFNARMDFEGITFRDLGELFGRGGPYGGEGGGSMRLVDSVVENCGSNRAVDAQWCLSESGLISGCRIVGNPGRGIFTYHYFGAIEECEIAHNGGTGIGGLCCEEPLIRQNHIHHNAYYGVSAIWMYTVEYNLIESNGTGGLSIYDGGSHSHNVIRWNPIGIEHWGVLGSIHENDIYDNEQYNVRYTETYASDRDLTMNWWGTTDPDEIAAGIWDCNDDPNVGLCVVFDPWCWSPGCTGTTVQPTTWGGIKALYR